MKKLLLLFVFSIFIISCNTDKEDDIFIPPTTEEKEEEPKEDDFEIFDPSTDPELTNGVKYAKDYIVFEPEVTTSNLGLWKIRTKGDSEFYESYDQNGIDPINNAYLEFTGNNLNGGAATSPLTYTFKSPKDGKFRIVMRMLQPLEKTSTDPVEYEAGDKRNDLYIKLQGNYTSACRYPKEQLESNHKFWGRGVRKWGSIIKLESHVNNIKVQQNVSYNFIKGEKYTLTISGRAQGCSIDYILFYDEAATSEINIETHSDPAAVLPEEYRPALTIID